MTTFIDRLTTAAGTHPAVAVAIAVAALAAAAGTAVAIRLVAARLAQHKISGEQLGTLVAAGIATGVSAQGMWVFFDSSLHLPLSLRIMFFAFLEIMVLTSALRARAAQQHGGTAGVDGVAMWVLTSLSAVLAATDADNLGTILIRLSAPLVAAWGWERSMALERRRSGNLRKVNWRITPERILIRLGLADPTDRTASESAAQRRLIEVALAADYARTLTETGAGPRRVGRAKHRLQKAMRRAIEDGGLVVEHGRDRQTILLDNIRILSGASALLDLELPNPWLPTVPDSAADPADPALATELAAPAQRSTTPDKGPAASEQAEADDTKGDEHPGRSARQLRRDPTVRARVLELRAANTPATAIAAELDTSPRTIGRILADLDAEAADPAADAPNPQSSQNGTTSAWHNGLRVLTGGTAPFAPTETTRSDDVLEAELIEEHPELLDQPPAEGGRSHGR